MGEVELSCRAYVKMYLHCCLFPRCSINGLLLSSSPSGGAVCVTDCVPLLHSHLPLAPITQLALTQVGHLPTCGVSEFVAGTSCSVGDAVHDVLFPAEKLLYCKTLLSCCVRLRPLALRLDMTEVCSRGTKVNSTITPSWDNHRLYSNFRSFHMTAHINRHPGSICCCFRWMCGVHKLSRGLWDIIKPMPVYQTVGEFSDLLPL